MLFDVIQIVEPAKVSIDVAAVDAALGILVGPLVGAITGPGTPSWLKSSLAIVLSLALGLAHVYFAGAFSLEQIAASLAVLIIFAGVTYQTITGPASRILQEKVPVKIGDKTA